MSAINSDGQNKNRLNLSINLTWVVILLLAVIAAMLFLWKPWNNQASGDRTISVTGETILKAEPDEYAFYPSYEVKNSDKSAALSALSTKSNQLVSALKKLGVQESNIKTNASGYKDGIYMPDRTTSSSTYTLSLTVTANTRELAQKVQDYLVSTSPSGAITPQPTFSQAKQKQLESQARNQAAKDARAKADQMAKNLGFSLGSVKSISEGSGFGRPIPLYAEDKVVPSTRDSAPRLAIQPGQNELHYSVSVTYYIR